MATNFHDPYSAQKVLGHQNLRTTGIYLHDLDVDRNAAALFDNITHGLTHEAGKEAEPQQESEKIPEKAKVRRKKSSTNEITNEITNDGNSTNEKGATDLP